ncbi:MAG: hypothetical protein ACOYK8_08660 [Alphaproteobacteria bacterium]
MTGNTEYITYLRKADEGMNFDSLLDELSEQLGDLLEKGKIVFLERDTPVVDGVAFVGVCGWWNFRMGEGVFAEDTVTEGIKNFHYPHPEITGQLIADRAEIEAEMLAERVAALQLRADVKEIVVVTHTASHPELVRPQWTETTAYIQQMLNLGKNTPNSSLKLVFRQAINQEKPDLLLHVIGAYTGNPSMKKVVEADVFGKISQWFYGHIHRANDRMIEHDNGHVIQYINASKGQPNDRPRGEKTLYRPKNLII